MLGTAPNVPVHKASQVDTPVEGYLTWAIGLRAQAPFKVLTLRGPDRLVIDIATR